ncbi:MAG: signal peptidase I, partial [Deltaproteobacteria bacterium]|nr:signal peptidase I [Deltaproteobacteria bacterium]
GRLFIDFKEVDEPYVIYSGDWNLEPRKVKEGNVYVAGDNRSAPIEQHMFGQTSIKRIVGAPMW